MSAKTDFEAVFTKPVAETLWTGNTLQVYPATPQDFSVGSLLPAVFYMFRCGNRRGAGRFQAMFGMKNAETNTLARARITWIASNLSSQAERFEGFDSDVAMDILGDLLLCDSLENKNRAEGHDAEVARAFPVHFFSSWLDLPKGVVDLRLVPEMLVALLANQPSCASLREAKNGAFGVGGNPADNVLLRIFCDGTVFGENATKLSGNGADTPDESADFSIEEWLMVRLAQTCGQAPERIRGVSEIPNLWPLATSAADIFREDLQQLLTSFGEAIPRRALTPMLESFIGLGLWHTFFASLLSVTAWERSGTVPTPDQQHPFPFFVDASNGVETSLRDLSEMSTYEASRFLDDAMIALAMVRILDRIGRSSSKLKAHAPIGTDQSAWLNLLGQVRRGDHPASEFLTYTLDEKLNQLIAQLKASDSASDAITILEGTSSSADPARGLAEALCSMIGDKGLKRKALQFIDSASMTVEPHGFVKKRSISRKLSTGKARRMDARSVVLSNTLLEALVHVHLAACGGRLSFSDFLGLLRERYGLWVDVAPPGISAAREDLLRNRAILERRLRDLGLLIGVNDAESMKRLRARYRTTETVA